MDYMSDPESGQISSHNYMQKCDENHTFACNCVMAGITCIYEKTKTGIKSPFLLYFAGLVELKSVFDHSAQVHLMFPARISFQSPITSWVQQSSAPADSLMVSAKM